jgi:NAD(P)-dependent dehydrogenase (short-subunit alcohol dehydrogenase family)
MLVRLRSLAKSCVAGLDEAAGRALLRIELDGRQTLVLGDGWLAGLFADAIERNGGRLSRAGGDPAGWPGRIDLLVDARGLGNDEAAAVVGDPCAAAAARMAGARDPKIVIALSVLGLVPARARPAYSAAQAVLAARVRTGAMALGARGIQVNGLAVGEVAGDPDAPALASHAALGRAGTDSEIAAAALFLLDPRNSYTTGHILVVDGGWQAGYARNF